MIAPACYRKNDAAVITERWRSMGLSRGETELESFLPLSDAAYLVLVALACDSDRAFLEVIEESAGSRALKKGALISALNRLVQLGLLAETAESNGERHRVTALGEAVLTAEAGRRRRGFDPPAMPKLSEWPKLKLVSGSGSTRTRD
jgi:DNA-binding MarR family transcriptional regulator